MKLNACYFFVLETTSSSAIRFPSQRFVYPTLSGTTNNYKTKHTKQKVCFCEIKHGTSLDLRCCFGCCRRRKRPSSAISRNGDGRRGKPSWGSAPTPGGDVQLHRLPRRLHPDPRRHERHVQLRPVRGFPVLRGVLLVPPLPQQLHPYHGCWHHHVPGFRVHRRPVLRGRYHGRGGQHPRRRRHGIAHPVARSLHGIFHD